LVCLTFSTLLHGTARLNFFNVEFNCRMQGGAQTLRTAVVSIKLCP
jgi:hypothetical protein